MEPREKTIKQLFIGNCWSYLHDNFHKFNETNKIKIALTLAQKDMPTVMEGGLNVNQMPSILVDKKPLELNLGNNATKDSGHSPEAPAPDNTVQ